MTLADKPTIGEIRRRAQRDQAYLAPLAEQARANIEARNAERAANADPEFEAYYDAYCEQQRVANEPVVDPTDPGPEPSPWAIRDAARDKADAEYEKATSGAHSTPGDAEHAIEANRFLNTPEPAYDWVVEGLFERGDRLILTGPEGGGKSTLQRQIAVQVASGIHPFTHDEIPPRRTLIVDLENGRRQIKRKIAELVAINTPAENNLWIAPHPQGLNLSSNQDKQWLTEAIEQTEPDFLMIGPLYKMNDGDPTEEKVAKPVAVLLDALREKYGLVIIMEAHTPHASGGTTKRPTRPYGASLWLRWPEFGLHLSPEGLLHHWRGARDERHWPALMTRGSASEWPWIVPADRNARFHDILQACVDAGRALSLNELVEATKIAKTTIRRAIEANAEQWDQMVATLELEPF